MIWPRTTWLAYPVLVVFCAFIMTWFKERSNEIEKKLHTERDDRELHERLFHHSDRE